MFVAQHIVLNDPQDVVTRVVEYQDNYWNLVFRAG